MLGLSTQMKIGQLSILLILLSDLQIIIKVFEMLCETAITFIVIVCCNMLIKIFENFEFIYMNFIYLIIILIIADTYLQ